MTTWNSGDKSANITLSGSSLVATTTSGTQGAVRATTSASTGKIYFEAVANVMSGNNFAVGWANSTASLSSFIGIDTNGVAVFSSGAAWLNNVNLGSQTGYSGFSGLTVCVAFDIDNKLIWFRFSNSLWNGSITADPATGTGGLSVSGLAAGPYFPAFCANSSGAQVTANFGATDTWFRVPSGFSTLDSNTQAFNASSKFLAYAPEPPPVTTVDASKMLGYGALPPTETATTSSKFVAYAVISGDILPRHQLRFY